MTFASVYVTLINATRIPLRVGSSFYFAVGWTFEAFVATGLDGFCRTVFTAVTCFGRALSIVFL